MKVNKVDFAGQIIYTGIDDHKKNWVITNMFNGIVLKTLSVNKNPDELVKYLHSSYPGAIYRSVYEAGYSGFWADRRLREAGIENIIVNPADVPTTHKEKRRKTDKIDSKKLARELSIDRLEGIYVPSPEKEAIRCLSRTRIQLTKDQTRTKNRIKALLSFSGIPVPENDVMKHWSANFIRHLSELKVDYVERKLALNFLLENLQQLRQQLAKVLKELRIMVRNNQETSKIVGHLLSVPGIGFITAVTLYTEIIDIKRFTKFDRFASFIGLTPDTNSSGEKDVTTGLTVRQKKYLRSLLIEAAWKAIRKDSALTAVFGNLMKRMDSKKAIVRIAKKLLSRIMYVWNNQKDYICMVVK